MAAPGLLFMNFTLRRAVTVSTTGQAPETLLLTLLWIYASISSLVKTEGLAWLTAQVLSPSRAAETHLAVFPKWQDPTHGWLI